MEKMIREILKEIVGKQAGAAGKDDDLRELGLDSVAFIQMVVALEDASGKEVGDEDLLLDNMNTIAKIEGTLQ